MQMRLCRLHTDVEMAAAQRQPHLSRHAHIRRLFPLIELKADDIQTNLLLALTVSSFLL